MLIGDGMILANSVLCALLPSYLSSHIQAWSWQETIPQA